MSNKDTSKDAYVKKNSKIDLYQKEQMLLFSYELLKSKKMINISGTNSFRYEFFEEKDTLKLSKNSEEPKMKVNNRTISIIDDENNSSLKTLNIEIPSAQRLSKVEFKNNLLKEYKTSFANFCGINKEQYENVYINNKYVPIIDNFGDIKINIKSIIKILNEYKSDKTTKKIEKQKLRKTFTMNKRNREDINNFKFPFKIKLKKLNINNNTNSKNDNNNNNNNNDINNNDINNKQINNNININNNKSINYNINNNNVQRNHFSINLKDKGKGLSINIPKERNNLLNNRPLLNLGANKAFQNLKIHNKTFSFQMGNSLNKNIISNIPNTINSVLSNSRQQHSSSDIFNFSNRDIRNYLNINNANLLNNLSPNIPLLTPIISPFPISPYHSIFSAHLSNNILQDGTNFNNTIINPNPFIFPNSPALINININNNINLNNNQPNGNILNNNQNASQNNSIKNNNISNNSINS